MNVTTPDSAKVVEELYAPLYRFALSLAGEAAAASDLTQEAFFRWFKHGGDLRDPSKVRSWLFTTLYREFVRTNRRAIRFPHHEIEGVEAELPTVAPEEAAGLDGALVLEALLQVDDAYRAPLSLFYLEGLSYAQIAEALDIPAGTVMSRLSRGRDQLRLHLKNRLSAEEQKLIPFAAVQAG
jgi:RNA polymerase sigma-70 factor (ECF subfamily)